MSVKNLIIILLLSVALCSCNMQWNESGKNLEEEKELREIAHNRSSITVKELIEYDNNSVYKQKLPCLVLTDKAILKEVKPREEIEGLDNINWIGFDGGYKYDYYAVFSINGGKQNSCFAYLGVSMNTANKILRYIYESREPVTNYFLSCLFNVNKIYRKNLPMNRKQFLMEGQVVSLKGKDGQIVEN